MKAISARIPDDLDNQLNALSEETDRAKGVLIRKALESFLNDKADLLIAMARLERGEETVSLEEIEKENDLGD